MRKCVIIDYYQIIMCIVRVCVYGCWQRGGQTNIFS